MTATIVLTPGRVRLGELRAVLREGAAVRLDPAAQPAVDRAAAAVSAVVARDETSYGINTGFGLLARERIPHEQLRTLQRNLILSHSAGTGPLLDDAIVRLALVLKIVSLGRGHSGVRWSLIDALGRLLEAGVHPCVPSKGSVGASGDLAPLAHLASPLIGIGEVRIDGRVASAAEGLARAGLEPLELAPKEGLALLNGTQISTALALAGLFAAEDILKAALVTGALATDAAKGSDTPFDPRIHAVRGQPGQIAVAAALAALLKDSAIRASHRVGDKRVQDPYCLRCQPQVMGACLDLLRQAARTLAIEANGVTDNPLVFAESGEILSGGNFHAEPVAFAADMIAIALCEIGSLAERRIAMLVDSALSGLPAFLSPDPGLNSGFMIAQVAAAALVSDNKQRAHPASVDSIPTSANQEDHVSMATHGAHRLLAMTENAATIAGIELLAAAQGCDFRAPLRTSAPLERVRALLRAQVPHLDLDRRLAPDIDAATALVRSGAVAETVGRDLLPDLVQDA